jgi:hypothetical protein
MGKVTHFGIAPPHDPIYGIDSSNITEKLTRLNWRTKAVCRIRDDRCLYVYVKNGSTKIDGVKCERYYVLIHLGSKEDGQFRTDFRFLKDAIAYANGSDGSDFAVSTTSAKSTRHPHSRGADTYITGFSRNNGRLNPNFTIRIPG